MTQESPSRNLDKFMLRLPDGMRDRIKESAIKSGRSMNAEIIYRIQDSFEFDNPVPGDMRIKFPDPLEMDHPARVRFAENLQAGIEGFERILDRISIRIDKTPERQRKSREEIDAEHDQMIERMEERKKKRAKRPAD